MKLSSSVEADLVERIDAAAMLTQVEAVRSYLFNAQLVTLPHEHGWSI